MRIRSEDSDSSWSHVSASSPPAAPAPALRRLRRLTPSSAVVRRVGPRAVPGAAPASSTLGDNPPAAVGAAPPSPVLVPTLPLPNTPSPATQRTQRLAAKRALAAKKRHVKEGQNPSYGYVKMSLILDGDKGQVFLPKSHKGDPCYFRDMLDTIVENYLEEYAMHDIGIGWAM